MQKRIVTIVFAGIGLLLGSLFVWYRFQRNLAEIREEARRLDLIAMIAMAQERYQKDAVRDEDKDGLGEFAGMADLFAARESKGGCVEIICDRYFRPHPRYAGGLGQYSVTDDGKLLAQGYVYSIFLPDTVNGRERNWCVFANPEKFTRHTYKTYFMDGRFPDRAYFTAYEGYSGRESGPALENVYEGKPFESKIRELELPSHGGGREEDGMKVAADEIRKSRGAAWMRCPIVYPEGYCAEK